MWDLAFFFNTCQPFCISMLLTQVLNFFAPEHGKGPCDGESAVIKRFIKWLMQRAEHMMTLDEIVTLLTTELTVLAGDKSALHSVHERIFFSVHGMRMYIFSRPLITFLAKHVLPFFICSDGTFPLATEIVRGAPPMRPNLSFMAFGNPTPQQTNKIFHRMVSCACAPCIRGSLGGCLNSTLVPLWSSSSLTFAPKPPLRTLQRNAADVKRKIQHLVDSRETFPFYYCLAWTPQIQHPTVLLMSHLRLNENTVRCHVLTSHNALPNDFGHCISRQPNVLCPRLAVRCQCGGHHAENFEYQHILEVATFKENGVHKTHIQRLRVQERGLPFTLVDLPSNPRNESLFENYARKRLQYFNDFFTV